jgi:PadR family transcriptional regulator PadR
MEKHLEDGSNSNELGEENETYKDSLERIIKANREFFVLFVVAERSMCGYDVIKQIFSRFNVFLSQGNVYPILYSLEEEGIIRAEFIKGDMRSKKYSITQEGRRIIQRRRDEFIKAMESILMLVKE